MNKFILKLKLLNIFIIISFFSFSGFGQTGQTSNLIVTNEISSLNTYQFDILLANTGSGTLEIANLNILDSLKKRNNNTFQESLSQRNSLSDKLRDLCSQKIAEFEDLEPEVKSQSKKLLKLDQELSIFLDLEIQKLRGKYYASGRRFF